ncbi:MAG: hypothetical protein IT335_03005 [Thermomicrobiales bacterium]|nr:hypothetical protein [Thermomicrobiales bacterium]
MTTLIAFCRDCGNDYELTRDDAIRGIAHWSRCPRCRGSPEAGQGIEHDMETEGSDR